MASTTFVNGSTLSDEDWFNDANRVVYTILGDPAAAGPLSITLNSAEQVRITATASADRYITLTGSNGSNPTIGVSAGNLNVSASTILNGSSTRSVDGHRIGADSTNNLIDDASNGAGTATLYIGNAAITVASDVRLKSEIADTSRDCLAIVKAIRVVDHVWSDPSDVAPNNRNSRGKWTSVVAQELVKHAPWLVNAPDAKCTTCLAGEKCDKHDSYWHVDMAHMGPLLARAVQQLLARVEALENASRP